MQIGKEMRSCADMRNRKFEQNKVSKTLQLSYPTQDLIEDFWIEIQNFLESKKVHQEFSLREIEKDKIEEILQWASFNEVECQTIGDKVHTKSFRVEKLYEFENLLSLNKRKLYGGLSEITYPKYWSDAEQVGDSILVEVH